ncbi:MAG: helix-turn-helix transcriptional regulator [Anaerostipes sp.]|nr:helix-turn-helix transcriptional regulator [Anaerostipes sp.]
MRIQKAIVKRIINLCHVHSISFYQLSILSAVPPSTIKNIINGKTKNPGIVTLKKICDGLGLSIQDFFDDSVFNDIEQEIL